MISPVPKNLHSNTLWNILLALLSLTMAALFSYSVIVQQNDPDPLRWMGVYGAAALLSAGALFPRIRRRIPSASFALLAIISLIWGCILIPQMVEANILMRSEVGREGVGLFIVSTWMAFLAWSKVLEDHSADIS